MLAALIAALRNVVPKMLRPRANWVQRARRVNAGVGMPQLLDLLHVSRQAWLLRPKRPIFRCLQGLLHWRRRLGRGRALGGWGLRSGSSVLAAITRARPAAIIFIRVQLIRDLPKPGLQSCLVRIFMLQGLFRLTRTNANICLITSV